MKPSRTTLAGSAAAAFFAAAQVPELPPWLTVSLNLAAAVAFALLGKHAAECPANCPGTNEQARPRPWQRSLFEAVALVLCSAGLCLILTGCVAANPLAGPDHPGQPAYIVSPSLTTASNTAVALAETTGQVTNTGPLPAMAVNGVFATIGALSLLWARRKSQATQVIAEAVAASGPATVGAVMNHAADTPAFTMVSDALNNALPKGQAPGGCCVGPTNTTAP